MFSSQLILAHLETVRGHIYVHCLLHARHKDITTLLVPHYVHYTTCHNLQRHTEHMIRAYTVRRHTYLVQQYRSTRRRKSKYDNESNESEKGMPCAAILPLMHTNVSSTSHTKKAVSQSGRRNLVCPRYCCTYNGLRDSLILHILETASFLVSTM